MAAVAPSVPPAASARVGRMGRHPWLSVLWTAALHFLETLLGAGAGVTGASEQLLGAIEDAGARWTVPRFAATAMAAPVAEPGEAMIRVTIEAELLLGASQP